MFEGTRFSANGMDFRNMRFEVRKVKVLKEEDAFYCYHYYIRNALLK